MELFYNKASRHPPKKLFFAKNGYISAILIRKRSFFYIFLRIIIGNFWRKLGEKISIRSIFGILPSTKMAVSRTFLGREGWFSARFIVLIWKSFLLNFMTIAWTIQFYQIFRDTKNWPYLGNYNRQRQAVTCIMFVIKKYLNNLLSKSSNSYGFQDNLGVPPFLKSIFFEKSLYFT